jgi:thiol-disulfide isomerase/thioredoxin
MAQSQELVKTTVSAENLPAPVKLIDVADGVYIFSGTYCPPCKLLHKSLEKIREALPNATFFEHAIDKNDEAQALIQRMGITILSIPLTVVVKNGVIASIISGYSGVEDYIQKLNAALK